MVELAHTVALHKVLVFITVLFNDAEIRLEDRVGILKLGFEDKVIAYRCATGADVVPRQDVELVSDVVVEVVLVWSYPRGTSMVPTASIPTKSCPPNVP